MENHGLDTLSDRELGRCAREVIEYVLRPGLQSSETMAAQACRQILDQLMLFARVPKPHGSAKWRGRSAIQLVAMVLRRTLAGKTIDEACADIGEDHVLPVTARTRGDESSPIDGEAVKVIYMRARARLNKEMLLPAVEALVGIEHIRHLMLTKGITSPPPEMRSEDRMLLELPGQLLPPDFPLRGASEPPSWVPSTQVVNFLLAQQSRHYLG